MYYDFPRNPKFLAVIDSPSQGRDVIYGRQHIEINRESCKIFKPIFMSLTRAGKWQEGEICKHKIKYVLNIINVFWKKSKCWF